MDITPNTKIFDLLEAHPHLEHFIINLAPSFKDLKNPLLRKSVGKVATLDQIARIGGLKVEVFVNAIRQAMDQNKLVNSTFNMDDEADNSEPDWIFAQPTLAFNGNDLLADNKNPLLEISRNVDLLDLGQTLTLLTDFKPLPLIDKMEGRGVITYSKEVNGKFLTYFRR